MEWTQDGYRLSDDPAELDRSEIVRLLHTSYWAADRPAAVIERGIAHSLNLGLFRERQQVGFCRAVTDEATFTWVCDVIVHPDHRGRGLGKWMVQCLLAHPRLAGTTFTLGTRDAHSLYEPFGFVRTEYLRRGKPVPHLPPLPKSAGA